MKIRKLKFHNHPVLGSIELNFCNKNDETVDTIIFAGENGVGKSTILNVLYKLTSRIDMNDSAQFIDWIEVEVNCERMMLTFFDKKINSTIYRWVKLPNGEEGPWNSGDLKEKIPSSAIFSDVDINFKSRNIDSVTSLSLDELPDSRKSENNLPEQINQLLIDIQASDDAAIAKCAIDNPELTYNELNVERKLDRFSNAFSNMFEDIKYDCVDNFHGNKVIYFNKYNKRIPINGLSSGEKQVVYRGCFLLKDVNAMNEALVFIDEPEISMHPEWQKKILDYYKDIFTNEDGKQTSQVFTVTHSPFIVHNDNRNNDKVIVLTRNDLGEVEVSDKPEYYYADSLKAVEDAFFINDFSRDESTVYLEGRTDEKYFNRALEVYGLDVPFGFKCVGYVDDNGKEVFTGSKNIDHAYNFLVSNNLPIKNFCLKDCDTGSQTDNKNNAYRLSIPKYKNVKELNAGIENALVLDKIDISGFYDKKIYTSDYGEKIKKEKLDKNSLCEYICSMDNTELESVLIHIREVIEFILVLYNQ